jgi:hypothetical protein
MEKTTRRIFCSTAILAAPALTLLAQNKEIGNALPDSPDPFFDALMDEFVRVTAEGAQNGFRAEQYRRYAAFMRMLDAQMEGKGINKELDKRLDEDDYYRLNPAKMAKTTVEYWRKRNLDFREDELTARLTMDGGSYLQIKKAIKKQGGVRVLHAKVAELFERKAKEYELSVYHGGPQFHQGRISFPKQREHSFVRAQFDGMYGIGDFGFDPSDLELDAGGWLSRRIAGLNLDCFCRALVVESAVISLLCIFTCFPLFCTAAATIMAVERLMEDMGMCNPGRC